MQTKKKYLIFLLTILLIFYFSGCNVENDELEENAPVILLSGVLKNYVPQHSINYSQITGGATAFGNINDILPLLKSDSIGLLKTEFHSVGYDYEVVLIANQEKYFSVITTGLAWEDVPILIAFAYSYNTKEVYYFQEDECYLVKNPTLLREKIGKLFADNGIYSDTKFFWKKADILKEYPVPNTEKSTVSYDFSFRYDRFWCIDHPYQDTDFSELDGYFAIDMNNMIFNLTKHLGYIEFEVILANDRITGYWRLEIYDVMSEKHALIYVDNNYQILFGTLIGY